MAGYNWVLQPEKFLSTDEAFRLLRTAERRATVAIQYGRVTAVRDYFVIDLALSTGLRVMEIARLNCGDLFLGKTAMGLTVRRGKGGRRRVVWFNGRFTRHCRQYLHWKRSVSEPTGSNDPLLRSSNTGGHLTTRAIEKAFKRTAARAGLADHYSIHCLRHTYACALYKATNHNLRMVQEQLGHASIRTTEVYTHVMRPDLMKALRKLQF